LLWLVWLPQRLGFTSVDRLLFAGLYRLAPGVLDCQARDRDALAWCLLQSVGPELGAWYAANDMRTASAEVGHHLRREVAARSVNAMTRIYRAYAATLLGDYLDIRGQRTTRPDVYASDRYDASQKLGEDLYDSLRRREGSNVVVYRPRKITDIAQTHHFEITVLATSRTIEVRKLSL
jgi:hypothetical protein